MYAVCGMYILFCYVVTPHAYVPLWANVSENVNHFYTADKYIIGFSVLFIIEQLEFLTRLHTYNATVIAF